MKIIRIAKLELSTLFYSPISWFLLIVFLFQCGLGYTSHLEDYIATQEMGLGSSLSFLTTAIFAPRDGLFPAVIDKLYLYLPLLTMGLMSREISSGTIKLLYSSPVKMSDIIFGKFIAMMVYNFLMLMVLVMMAAIAMVQIESADYSLLLAGLLGIYLLLCAYAAIGLFMSCLTSYQVVAAISTFLVFGALNYIGLIWQDIDFVRDLTYFLSISGRTENMLAGLISSKDILYFGLIVCLFLGLSIIRLKAGREARAGLVTTGRYALIIVSTLLIGYISSRPAWVGYYDATATKTRTLTTATQKVIDAMKDEPLDVTSYINLLDVRYIKGTPDQRNADMDRWEPYLRFMPDIRFKYVYYYDSARNPNLYKSYPGKSLEYLGGQFARSFKKDLADFKTPAEIHKIVDLGPEENRYVMQLSYKGKKTFLRLFNDFAVFPGESETAAALKRLTTTLPKIAFVEGELERSITKAGDREYNKLTSQVTFRFALVNQGFDVESISLSQPIPKDIAVLVIADPRIEFSAASLASLRQYINDGGNLLIAGEPGKQSVLNPLVRPLGVELMDGILVQKSKDFAPDLLLTYTTKTTAGFSRKMERIFNDSNRIAMPGACGLSYTSGSEYDIQPMLLTDARYSWNKKGKLTLDSAAVQYTPADGDEKRAIPTALRLVRTVHGKEQRIVVTGDADFLSNREMSRQNVGTANFGFNTALFGWFTYGQFPIDTSRPASKDNRIHVTGSGLIALKWILLGVLPALLLLVASVLLIKRKRQ